MMQELIVLPEVDGKQDLILKPGLEYKVPANVWVMDAQTMQMLPLETINLEQATKVILIPKIRGG